MLMLMENALCQCVFTGMTILDITRFSHERNYIDAGTWACELHCLGECATSFYSKWVWLCERGCVCARTGAPVCVNKHARVCVCVCILVSLAWLIWKGANWHGAATSSCFVRTWRPFCRINKSWSSEFCHMPSHVFPFTSWEHSALSLSYSPTLCATGTTVLQSGTRDSVSLRW